MAGQGDTAADKGAKTVAARIYTEQPAICFAGFSQRIHRKTKGISKSCCIIGLEGNDRRFETL